MNFSVLFAVLCSVSCCMFMVIVDAHSYPGCTKLLRAPSARDGTCVGFVQGYPATNIYGQGFDGMLTNQLTSMNSPLCKWTHAHYENANLTWSNRAAATPGETLWFRWNDFGHHPGGNYPGPSNFSLYWNYNDPSVDFNQLTAGQFLLRPGNKWMVNPTRSDLMFPSPWTSDFLDPICRDQRVPCIQPYTIPADTKPGIYSFFWFWDLEGYTRPDNTNVYTSCFDIEVRDSHPTDAGAPFASGNPFQLTVNGLYLVTVNGALTTSDTGGDNSYFTTTVLGPGLIGLSSTSNNQFISIQPNGQIQVNRPSPSGSWEQVFVNQLDDGRFTIKSIVHGLFLTVNGDGVSFTLPTNLSDVNYIRVPGSSAAPPLTPTTPRTPAKITPSADLTPPEIIKATVEGTVTLNFPEVTGATGYRVHVKPINNGVRGSTLEFNFSSQICDAGVCKASLSTQRTTSSFVYAIASTRGANTVSAYTTYKMFN